jgi:hypothetical protein
MRLSLAAAATLLALAAPRSAQAQGTERTVGPVLGLRLAWARSFGSVAADVPTDDAVSGQIPLQLDALWSFPELAAGLYASYGVAGVGNCAGSCSGSVWRVGLQAARFFGPRGRGPEPWLGISAGYEWAEERRARAGRAVETTWRGFELLAAQGGVEWRVGPRVAVGPFLLAGAGRYAAVDMDTGFDTASAEIPEKAFHYWIHVGVRARLALGGSR